MGGWIEDLVSGLMVERRMEVGGWVGKGRRTYPLTAMHWPPKRPSAEGMGGLRAFFSTKFLKILMREMDSRMA